MSFEVEAIASIQADARLPPRRACKSIDQRNRRANSMNSSQYGRVIAEDQCSLEIVFAHELCDREVVGQ